MTVSKGLEGAIFNPPDKGMTAAIAEALAGPDNYCGNYLQAFRGGLLED